LGWSSLAVQNTALYCWEPRLHGSR